MSVLQRDVNKIAIDSRCPDIHIQAPQANTALEEAFSTCTSSRDKTMDKLFECQKDLVYCKISYHNSD